MKTLRIFLLVLIIVGVGALASEKIWVPKLVDEITSHESPPVVISANTIFKYPPMTMDYTIVQNAEYKDMGTIPQLVVRFTQSDERVFDIKVDNRELESITPESMKEKGATRFYSVYRSVDGATSVTSNCGITTPCTTINFQKGESFFNINIGNIENSRLKAIFNSFHITPIITPKEVIKIECDQAELAELFAKARSSGKKFFTISNFGCFPSGSAILDSATKYLGDRLGTEYVAKYLELQPKNLTFYIEPDRDAIR